MEIKSKEGPCYLFHSINNNIYYQIDDYKRILRVDETKKGHKCIKTISNYIGISKKLVDIDTRQIALEIVIVNGDDVITHIFPSSVLTEHGINELFNYGLRVSKAYVTWLIEYLMLAEEQAETVYCYKSTGWHGDLKNLCFKLNDLYQSGKRLSGYMYTGAIGLTSSGDIKRWTQMIREEVSGNTPLEFVLMLGFSAPVLALLNESNYDLGTLMFNLSNLSSKGKTTSAMLAASVFSNPACNKGTLITHHATDNALVSMLSSCSGITVGIDESGISKHSNNSYSNLLYTICSGCSKLRLNGDSTMKEMETFSCVVISTAEYDIVTEDMPEGIKARVFELTDELTKSAENSDNIKKVIMSNYGKAGKKFVGHLTAMNFEDIICDYEKSKAEIENAMKRVGNLGKRMISKLAVVFLTTKYCNKIFNSFNVNEEKMMNYICSVITSCGRDYSCEQRILEVIKNEFINESYIYPSLTAGDFSCYPCVVVRGAEVCDVYVKEIEFKEQMAKYNIANYKRGLKEMKRKAILVCSESDRLLSRTNISNKLRQRVNCYHFRLENE